MAIMRKIFCSLAVIIVIGVLLIFSGGWFYLTGQLPDIEGSIRTPDISNPTQIVRDRWGIPHISAEIGTDAYFALGYAQAQDRLFQMELQRRVAKGELSEIFGPSTIDVDKMFRTLMLRHRAEAYLRKTERINPEALQLLDAFLDGINHFINIGPLPVEFRLLGFTPEPFTRLDSLSAVGYLAFSLANGLKNDSLQTVLSSCLSPGDIEILFPEYTRDDTHTIMVPGGIKPDSNTGSNLKSAVISNGDIGLDHLAQSLIQLMDKASNIVPQFTGSNSWVLAPSKSSNGHALLANDPHISIALPGTWYEAHVRFPGYENYGYHLPLLPFPMLGHNDKKGWAITMLENDDMDLYAETFHPEDPNLVCYKGKWVKAEILEETIRIKGGLKERHQIRITQHGPIISDYIPSYKGKPVALSWVYHDLENPILDIVWGMATASNLVEFRNAISKLTAPGLNISYVDHHGNIGWWAAGRFLIRPPHVTGKQILDGSTGKDDSIGYMAFEKNPFIINPENGLIITANNLPTHEPVEPLGKITGYFSPSDRAARIYELLSAKEKWSIEELKTIQIDTRTTEGKNIAGKIIPILDGAKDTYSNNEKTALAQLKAWDGFMATDSIGGSVFQFTVYHITKELLEPLIGHEHLRSYLNLKTSWSFLKRFAQGDQPQITGKNPYLHNRNKEEIIRNGFKNAVAEMTAKLGSNHEHWNWGNVHTIEFQHPLGKKKPLNYLFNIGPLPCPSEAPAINKFKSLMGKHDYRVESVPSTRRLIDGNNPGEAFSILPTGNSGNVMSSFYKDQLQAYLEGRYRKIAYTELQIAENALYTLNLLPQPISPVSDRFPSSVRWYSFWR